MQNRLVVAMLDADNVQAVDFLSNKVGRPLKVYAASEAGVRRILEQYEHSLERGVASIFQKEEEAQKRADDEASGDDHEGYTIIIITIITGYHHQ